MVKRDVHQGTLALTVLRPLLSPHHVETQESEKTTTVTGRLIAVKAEDLA